MPDTPGKERTVKDHDDELVNESRARKEIEMVEQVEKGMAAEGDASPIVRAKEKDDDGGALETPRKEITTAYGGGIITATKGREMSEQFLLQERKQGNATNWEFEKKDVEFYCRWSVFRVVKFPTRDMMEFSLPTEGMSKEDLMKQRGMICRLVVKRFGDDKSDKEKWWNAVKDNIMMTFVKRRSAVTEGLKKVYEGKCDWLAVEGRNQSVCQLQ